MTLQTLEELYAQHTGKVSDKWSAYLHEYDRIFREQREQPMRFLEIGIQNGGSLEIWAKYFPNATQLIGCDINPACASLRYEDPRIAVIVGDANADATQMRITKLAQEFEVVIDDGSHRTSDVIRAFARYFPLLADGGVFVVEDLHCSYWAEFEGGLFDPFSSVAFFKRLADIVHHEHWGIAKTRAEVLKGIFARHGTIIEEEELAHVHSVEFSNSMCVIRKARRGENEVGRRFISGQVAAVEPQIAGLHGSTRADWNQETNSWSNRPIPPDEELPLLIANITSAAAAISTLQGHIADCTAQRDAALKALADREEQLAASAATITDLALSRLTQEKEQLSLSRRLAASRAKNDKLKRTIAKTEQSRAILLETRSWRLTRPLRIVRKKLKGAAQALTPPGGYYRASRRVRKVLLEKGLGGATQRLTALCLGRATLAPVDKRGKPQKRLVKQTVKHVVPHDGRNDYAKWVRTYDTLTPEALVLLSARAKKLSKRPLISVIMPTYNPELPWLIEAIESVRSQVYRKWELCIADDASTNPVVRGILEHYARLDPRIKVTVRPENGHISAASNSALELATGEWIALLDHDDVLRENALFWVADAINEVKDVRLLYSDEDKLGETGERQDPHFKSDWNPDLFHSYNMICHLGVYDAALVRAVGGFRLGMEGSQDYDLALRCVERLESHQIHHIPRVLYSWRAHPQSTASSGEAKPYAELAGKRALDEHFERRGMQAHVELTDHGVYRARYALPASQPMVSLIIPTRNAVDLVKQCIDSIIDRTTYESYEILLVDNGSDDPRSLAYFSSLSDHPRVRVIRDDRPFNYSALNNAAVKVARGEIVGLVNNDIEVVSPDWLSEMVSLAIQPEVGAVGARLWYPNDTLQHGGVVLGIGGVAGHAHKYLPKGKRGYYGRADLIQSFSAVTGACLLVRKSVYEQVQGLNEIDLRIAFNDVDFCLRIREAGYRNVWTPYAELYHHESATRGTEDTPEKQERFAREVRFMMKRWGEALLRDPAYNPNLTLVHEDFSLAWPPRVEPVGKA